jgi:dTDP-4-dehydrorhamnose reductase
MRDAGAVASLIEEVRPSWVAVPAANPHVDYCELHPEETRQVNVAGVLNVARACRDASARMVFFSSDYVFDGRQGRYSEADPPSPINEYGRQKAEVEREVLALSGDNLVVRTAGAYGWQEEPKNFVLQVRANLAAGKTMKVADDVKYNPTYVENLAELTADLCERSCRGVFNVVGSETINRFEFARRAARVFGFDAANLVPVSSREFRAAAPRPKESSLLTDKVRGAAATPLWGVDEGLAHMAASESAWRRHSAAMAFGRANLLQ